MAARNTKLRYPHSKINLTSSFKPYHYTFKIRGQSMAIDQLFHLAFFNIKKRLKLMLFLCSIVNIQITKYVKQNLHCIAQLLSNDRTKEKPIHKNSPHIRLACFTTSFLCSPPPPSLYALFRSDGIVTGIHLE